MSLDELRTTTHEATSRLLRRRLDLALGRPGEGIDDLRSRLPEPFEPGVAREALEAARSAEAKGLPPRARRLKLLSSTLVDLRTLALEPGAFARLSSPATLTSGDGGHATAVEALRTLRLSTSREERRRLCALVDAAVTAREDDRKRLDDAGRRAATEAGFAGQADALNSLHGVDLPALRTMAESFLTATDAMYRDVLDWWLGRSLELRPHPDGAAAFDVAFALSGPLAPSARPAGDIASQLLRLSRPLALGRDVRHELVTHPAAPDRPTAFVVDAPDDVRVVSRRAADWGDVHGHLVAAGAAFHAAGIDANRPAEDRLLGDAAVALSTGYAFGALLFDTRWLKRTLGAEAADLVRLLRLMDLCEARRAAVGLLTWSDRLDGVSIDARLVAERMSLAVGGTVAPGTDDSDRTSADRFRARLVGTAMHTWLCGRFDDDWWRNPSAGTALQGLFAAGGFLSLDDLANIAGGPASVEPFIDVYETALQ